MRRSFFKRIGQAFIPCVVLSFTVVYVLLTKQIFLDCKLVIPNEKDSIWEAIFKSPEIIKMFQIIIFYSVPVFVFMLFMSLLSARIQRFSISLGNCKIDLDQQNVSSSVSSEVSDIDSSCHNLPEELLGQHSQVRDEPELNKRFDDFILIDVRYRYQLELVNDFISLINAEEMDFYGIFLYYLSLLKDIFCSQIYGDMFQLYNGFYLFIDDKIVPYNMDGMNSQITVKIQEFLSEVKITKQPCLVHDLDKYYPKIIIPPTDKVVYSVLGVPVLLTNREVFGITLVYSTVEVGIFTQVDLCILNLLSQALSIGLAKRKL